MRKIKVGCLMVFLVLALICTLPAQVPAQAPTQAEIEQAIVDGVAWLANQQEVDGSWPDYWYNKNTNCGDLATTGLAVLKLEERAYELGHVSPFDPDYEYHGNVTLGLNCLFSHLLAIGVTLQNHISGATGAVDDPDFNGNGFGVYAAGHFYDVYNTGIALAAISASGTPLRLAANGVCAGKTYLEIAQDMVDWIAWAQSDADAGHPFHSGEGGWAYHAIDNGSIDPDPWERTPGDNSNSGYAVMGLAYAIRFGCGVPLWVKTELNAFIVGIQDPSNGGSWYWYPWDGIGQNILKTGNLIFEMRLFGDTPTTPRVVKALNYISNHWKSPSWYSIPLNPGWDGDPAEYQTMFCAMKGLQYMGINTFDSINWYADFSDRIVAQQCKTPGLNYGSWNETSGIGTPYIGAPVLITEWALLTLEKASPSPIIHLDAEPPLLIDLGDRTLARKGTMWHELYPSYCNWYQLAGWFDSNNNSILDRCDNIILDNETGYSGWYNVEDVTVTLRLTNSTLNETMYVEFNGNIQVFPFDTPLNTTWHEVYPEYGNWFNLTKWDDTNSTNDLNPSDHIEMTPIPYGINATIWHVDAVKTDLLVTFEKNPDFGDAINRFLTPAGDRGFPSNLFSSLDYAVPPDMVSYWKFDETGGPTAYDFFDGNDGTLTNGPLRVAGFHGNYALKFDGTDDYVRVPDVDDSLDFGAGEGFSVQAWINASDISGTRTIVDKRQGPIGSELGYAVFIWSGRLGLQLADAGYTNYVVPVDMKIIADNQWHFVFVSVDRENARATFYVDDKEISIPIGHPGSLASTADLWIGGNHLGSYYFEGGIDEVAIYNRALTSREVRQLRLWQVRDGASHVDWNYEWLGKSVSGEPDSKQVDKDEFDDGVKAEFHWSIPMDHTPVYLRLWITISTSGQSGRYSTDPNDVNKKMYLNAWIDWNHDLYWADNEKIIGTGGQFYDTQMFAGPQIAYYSILTPESFWLGGSWLRVRLDYGEDVGRNPQSWTDPSLDEYKGQAMFGEVEDYYLSSDVAIPGVIPLKTVIGQGYGSKINFTVANQGGCIETFNVTVYANATAIGNQTVTSLPAGETQTFSLNWNTTGFAKGSYIISAYAQPLPYENDTSNNNCTYGAVCVSIPGDINGDRKDDLKDVFAVGKAYGSAIGDPRYNPNLDINDDGKIDLKDYFTTCKNYGKSW